jgi:hypothetical protein
MIIEFHIEGDNDSLWDSKYDYRKDSLRTTIIKELESYGVILKPVTHISTEGLIMRWYGQLYMENVPYDFADPLFKKVWNYLEFPDETTRFPSVRFCCISLEFSIEHLKNYDPDWEM